MVQSPETEAGAHPYWYAQVLGVFHTTVSIFPSSKSNLPQVSSTQVEFLWVRWYGIEPGYRSGFKYSKLPKIGFVPENDRFAFGFLDPSVVIRGCHLIPAFALGRTRRLLRSESTLARKVGERKDWMNYYVGMFADRDMALRYSNMGVGHQVSRIHAQTLFSSTDGESGRQDDEDDWDDVIDDNSAPSGKRGEDSDASDEDTMGSSSESDRGFDDDEDEDEDEADEDEDEADEDEDEADEDEQDGGDVSEGD
ncbi:hypothetical protein QCA50_007213 [Cerrena zonata]|uniref:Uncharacterized protein n=1 Tax=Cerrena zonata TaxID=2478898 RepID=A0AAW0G7V3_9APHY